MVAFRKACRFLHREIGFLVVGLTLAYAISGIAVNHVDAWNPSYSFSVETSSIEPVDIGSMGGTDMITSVVLSRLALDEPVKNTWRPAPDRLQVFVEGATYEVELTTGTVSRQGVRPRPLLADVNFLHLNKGKGVWTWAADVYAGLLVVLALTGPWLVRGRKGLVGRGGVWLALGIALPVLYLVVLRPH